jgi:hypothetical protein
MLIIYNPNTDKASTTIDINVGNFNNDQDIQDIVYIIKYKPRILYSF